MLHFSCNNNTITLNRVYITIKFDYLIRYSTPFSHFRNVYLFQDTRRRDCSPPWNKNRFLHNDIHTTESHMDLYSCILMKGLDIQPDILFNIFMYVKIRCLYHLIHIRETYIWNVGLKKKAFPTDLFWIKWV